MTYQVRGGSVYGQTARFDTGRALTESELRLHCPSVFATEAHSSRSDRFRAIPTIEIIRGLEREGFSVVGAKQSTARDDSRADFTKHLLRLRRLNDGKTYSVGDTVFEMLMKNANDGSSIYDLMGGLFRIACLNSMVRQTSTLDAVKVRHTGNDVLGKVIEGTYRVLNTADAALAAPQDWSRINLNTDDREAFATAAHVLRFGDAEGETNTLVKPMQLLQPRRVEDRGNDLWKTFNVAQEACIKGGVQAQGRDTNTNRFRRVTTRPVNGIDQDVRLNKSLWILAQHFAAGKAGQAMPIAA